MPTPPRCAKIVSRRGRRWRREPAAVAGQADAPLRDVDQTVRDLKAVLEPQAGGSGSAEAGKGAPPDAVAAELRAVAGRPRRRAVRELRDAEDWRRWANSGIQEALVAPGRGAEGVQGSAQRRPPAARPASAVEGRQRRARRVRRALAALQGRRRRAAGALRRAGAAGRGGAGRAPGGPRRRCANRPKRWPSRPTGSPPRTR